MAQVAGVRRMLCSSAFVVAVAGCYIAGVSLASHALNVIVEVFAVVFGLGLAGFSFILRPRLVGVPAGLCALVAWLMLMLFLSMGAVFVGGGAGTEITVSDGSVCGEAGHGMIGSDSGVDITAFRPFLFVDQRIATRSRTRRTAARHTLPGDPQAMRRCLHRGADAAARYIISGRPRGGKRSHHVPQHQNLV